MLAEVREINSARQSSRLRAGSSGISSSRVAAFFLDSTPLYLYYPVSTVVKMVFTFGIGGGRDIPIVLLGGIERQRCSRFAEDLHGCSRLWWRGSSVPCVARLHRVAMFRW